MNANRKAEAAAILAEFLRKHPTIKYFYSSVPLLAGSIPPTAAFTSLSFRCGCENGDFIPYIPVAHIIDFPGSIIIVG